MNRQRITWRLVLILALLIGAVCRSQPAQASLCASYRTVCFGGFWGIPRYCFTMLVGVHGANLATDPLDCGSCGNVCPHAAGTNLLPVCSNGQCKFECQSSLTQCGNACVDTSTDVANCGACGNACQSGQTCQSGKCLCPDGNPLNTNTDCGSCGSACAPGAFCSNLNCVCAVGGAPCLAGGGERCCSGTCSITQSDPNNCGGCGVLCTGSTPLCVNGVCTAASCAPGLTWCSTSGYCAYLPGDFSNCGSCGTTCQYGCNNSQCCPSGPLTIQGPSGFTASAWTQITVPYFACGGTPPYTWKLTPFDTLSISGHGKLEGMICQCAIDASPITGPTITVTDQKQNIATLGPLSLTVSCADCTGAPSCPPSCQPPQASQNYCMCSNEVRSHKSGTCQGTYPNCY